MKINLLEYLLDMNESRLYAFAFKDPVTGVLNRKAFELEKSTFIAIVDADSLKYINDHAGHEAGDSHLRLLALNLVEAFGEGRVYRLGGDEFAIRAEQLFPLYRKLRYLQRGFPMFSFGIGVNLADADEWLRSNKSFRLKAGQRSARGEAPAWL